jgi:hypothetical protein
VVLDLSAAAVIARVMAAYWADRDKVAAGEYAQAMTAHRNCYLLSDLMPESVEERVRVAAQRKAHTHTMLTKWANRAAGRGRWTR